MTSSGKEHGAQSVLHVQVCTYLLNVNQKKSKSLKKIYKDFEVDYRSSIAFFLLQYAFLLLGRNIFPEKNAQV